MAGAETFPVQGFLDWLAKRGQAPAAAARLGCFQFRAAVRQRRPITREVAEDWAERFGVLVEEIWPPAASAPPAPATKQKEEEQVSELKCDVCGQSVNGKGGLAIHKSRKHGVKGATRTQVESRQSPVEKMLAALEGHRESLSAKLATIEAQREQLSVELRQVETAYKALAGALEP